MWLGSAWGGVKPRAAHSPAGTLPGGWLHSRSFACPRRRPPPPPTGLHTHVAAHNQPGVLKPASPIALPPILQAAPATTNMLLDFKAKKNKKR